MTFRILVTGSRTWTDEQTVREALRSIWREFHLEEELYVEEDIVLVHGDAIGLDRMAAAIWKSADHPRLVVEAHPVTKEDYSQYGRRAPLLRNDHMISLGADVVLAFPVAGSRGTRYTIDHARKAGLDVRIFEGGE